MSIRRAASAAAVATVVLLTGCNVGGDGSEQGGPTPDGTPTGSEASQDPGGGPSPYLPVPDGVVLKLDPRLAPVKVAVLPLSRNADLSPKAKDLAASLRGLGWNVDFDDSGAIGRRYRRQDEVGTPYCVTVDFDTLDDHAVTIRERDTMKQERISLDQVVSYFAERLVGC